MSTSTQSAKRERMWYHLDQVEESGLLSPERLSQLKADIESRLSHPQTSDGHPITNAIVAAFPDGRRMLYSQLSHDPQQTYCRRDLLEALLTDAEVNLINDCFGSAASRRREEERFAKAQRIAADDWTGWVCDGDTYHESVEAYLDQWVSDNSSYVDGRGLVLDADAQLPVYVWAAIPQAVIPKLEVADVVEHHVCDRGWEDCSVDDLEGVAELQAALDRFTEANSKVVAYQQDTSRAILLPPMDEVMRQKVGDL